MDVAHYISGKLIPEAYLQVHSRGATCEIRCCIHNPSDHSLKEAGRVWRPCFGRVDRRCSHGILHPDPDDLWFKRNGEGWEDPDIAAELRLDHDCDGCCVANKPAEGDHFMLPAKYSPGWARSVPGFDIVTIAREEFRIWKYQAVYVTYLKSFSRHWSWNTVYPEDDASDESKWDLSKGWWEVHQDAAVIYHPPS